MRRPHFCCDKDHYDEQCCSTQSSGSIARLRRFLAISLGRSRSTSTPVAAAPPAREPCQAPCLKPCNVLPPAATYPNLLSDILGEAENSLGRPLEEVMVGQGHDDAPHGGVPSFLHAVCCHMLTHEVDYDTLTSVDWCGEEIRAFLLDAAEARRGRGIAMSLEESFSQATLSAGLLRLFLQELPHPLMPREVASSLSSICKEIFEVHPEREEDLSVRATVASRIRRFLFSRLPPHNLRLLQYLAAFLHQLRTANHNTCPVSLSNLSLVLGRVLTRSFSEGAPANEGNRIAQVLLFNYVAIFSETSFSPEDAEYFSSDSVSSSCGSHGENTDTDLFTADSDDEPTLGIEEEEDEDDSTTTTTTTDTDELRSPLKVSLHSSPSGGRPPSPCKSRYPTCSNSSLRSSKRAPRGLHMPGSSTTPVEPLAGADSTSATATPSSPNPSHSNVASCSGISVKARPAWPSSSSGLDKEGPSLSGTSAKSTNGAKCSFGTQSNGDGILPRLKRKEHTEGDAGEHDPKALRSTAEIQDVDSFRHSKIAPFGKGYLPSITDLLKSPDDSWRDEGIRSYSQDKDNWNQSCESSCLSEGEESESDADGDADGSDTESLFGIGLEKCPHEERRSSERSFPRSHKAPSGSRRARRRTRRKHDKNAPIRIQSSEEEEKDSKYCFSSLLSRDEEEPTTFDPTPPDDNSSQPFRDLLAFNEPVTSDRASWGLKMDMSHSDKFHRTARHYSSRYEEEKPLQGNWFKERDAPEGSLTSKKDSSEEQHPPAGQAAIKVLMRNMSSIKKKIKKFEEEFENAFGYKPSHSEKMKHKDIKKYMAELNKMRKQLKQMKDDVAEILHVPNVFHMSLFRPTENKKYEEECPVSGTVTTIREVEERLREKRKCANRPVDLNSMTVDQIQDEKTALQRALLYYESLHGRPSTKEERDLARPLYDRYRQVKRSIVRSSSRTKENLELAPILEHVVMDFTLASPQHRGSLQEEIDSEAQEEIEQSAVINPDPHPEVVPGLGEQSSSDPKSDDSQSDFNLGDLHALPLHELKERKKEAKDEKKRLRRSLREFEEKFERENRRKVQKEDRGPMEKTYTDYKHAKAKLRLLEALLSKHDNTAFK